MDRALARDFLVLGGSEAVTRGLIFAAAVAVSRVLGPSALGQLAFAQALVGYFVMVADAGLTTLVLREIVRRPNLRSVLVVNATTAQCGLVTALTGALLAVASWDVLPRGTGAVLMAISPLLFAQAFNLSYVLQSQRRMAAVGALKVCREIVATGLGLLLLVTTRDVRFVAAAVWVGMLASDVVGAWLLRHDVRLVRPRPATVADLLRRGSPFLASALLVQVIINFDVMVLGFTRGDEEVGFYAAAYRLAFYAAMIAGVAVTAVFPELVLRWEAGGDAFGELVRRLFRVSAVLSAPLVAFLFAGSGFIVELLYGEGFQESAEILRFLAPLPALGWYNTFAGQALVAADRQRANLKVTAMAAGATVVALSILVPMAGARGAAIGATCVEIGSLTAFGFALRRVTEVMSLRLLFGEVPAMVVLGGAWWLIERSFGNAALVVTALGTTVLYLAWRLSPADFALRRPDQATDDPPGLHDDEAARDQ